MKSKKMVTVAIVAMMVLAMAICLSACDDITGFQDSNLQGIADAAGIASIEKTSTEGLVDTYTVTFNDGSTCYFTVTNGLIGQDGIDGEPGIQGLRGEDGATPIITINSEGYWIINGELSSVRAKGIKGDTGAKGADGITPTISINDDGYWVINEEITKVLARGESAESPTIEISDDGHWIINGEETEYLAQGAQGEAGESGRGIKYIQNISNTDGVSVYKVVFTDNTFWEYKIEDGNGIKNISIKDGKLVIEWTKGGKNTEIEIPRTEEEVKADKINAVNILFASYSRSNYTPENWEEMRNIADDARYKALNDESFNIDDVKAEFDAIDIKIVNN